MLAGKAPFQATNPHGYILKHVTEKPPPIGATNAEVKAPPQLEAIIMKSLEKSRDNRYASAADFAAALEAIRNSITPDQKYGLGEKMITLSGAQTLADLSKIPTGTYTGGTMGSTMGSTKVGPTGTRVGSDEATVMERAITPGTLSGSAPTQMERKGAIGSNEATVMENFGAASAAPTVVEAKMKFGGGQAAAEPTVLERQISMTPAETKKSKMPMIAGIAAVLVIAIALGVFMMNKKKPDEVVTNTVAPPGTQVTTTAPLGNAPIAGGNGALLLSASPYADIAKIINADNHASVPLPEDTSTPTRVDLKPGNYTVTLNGPNGSKEITVAIEAGKRTPHHENMSKVNIEDLAKEMNP
jgi:hypothetical protein